MVRLIKIRALVIVILLIMTAGGWFYFADKFEKIANDEILPKLHNTNSLLSFDKDSITVEKFKFRITLQNVIIMPESEELVIKADEVVIGYHPFADKIKINFVGDKLAIGEKFYFAHPNHSIEFDRSLTKRDFEKFSINIKSEDSELFYTKDNSPVVESKQIDLSISKAINAEDTDVYTMIASFNIDSAKPNLDSVFFKEVGDLIKNEFGDVFKDTDLYNDYKEAFSENNALNYQAHYSAKLPKKTLQELIDASLEEKKTEAILLNLLKSTNIYSFKIQERAKGLFTRYNGALELYGNGKETAFMLNASNIQHPNEAQKQFIIKNGSTILLNAAKIMSEKEDSTIFKNLEASDLDNLLKLNLNTGRSSFQLGGKYNVTTSDFEHTIKFTIDDFDISFNGKGDFENKAYKGTFEISDPRALTDNVSQVYITAINPIFLKLNNPPKELNITAYNQIAVNIQDNGFNALAAFHENDLLNNHEKLISNLTFKLEGFKFNINDKGFKFNINDKGFFKILTDERITKFLQAMPDTDKIVVK